MATNPTAFEYLSYRMPPGCTDELKKHYESGQTLYSEILEKAAIPITQVQYRSGTQDNRFYHWTSYHAMDIFKDIFYAAMDDRDKAHMASVHRGSYDDVFLYLRANPNRGKGSRTPSDQSLWTMQWFVAEDSNIDMIDYVDCGADSYGQYFQILSPKKIIRTVFSD